MLFVVVASSTVFTGSGLPTESNDASAQTAERPNFVVVMTDDLDEQSMEQLGGIREVMGSNGTTFENFYVTQPLCCPSRSTFLRGQYPHNHGVIDNALPQGGEKRFRELGLDQSTIATWLDDVGYQTKYIGKYMNSYYDLYVPSGWDEWFALTGPHNNNEVNDDGQSVTIAGNSTDAFAGETDDFIRRSSANPEPFFVMVGTKAPHTHRRRSLRVTRTASLTSSCQSLPISTRKTSPTSLHGCSNTRGYLRAR